MFYFLGLLGVFMINMNDLLKLIVLLAVSTVTFGRGGKKFHPDIRLEGCPALCDCFNTFCKEGQFLPILISYLCKYFDFRFIYEYKNFFNKVYKRNGSTEHPLDQNPTDRNSLDPNKRCQQLVKQLCSQEQKPLKVAEMSCQGQEQRVPFQEVFTIFLYFVPFSVSDLMKCTQRNSMYQGILLFYLFLIMLQDASLVMCNKR